MKVIKGFISTILALIVIPLIMAFIVYLSASAIVSKKNVEKLVKEINISNFLVDEDGNYNELGNDIKDELVKNGLPSEVVDEFVNSKEISDFFSKYAGEFADFIINDKEIEQPTAEDISKLINENIDSIVAELKEKKVEGYEELTDENIELFKSHVDEVSKEIENNLPDIEEALEDSEAREAFKIIRFIFSNVVYMIIFGVIAIFLILIALLNLKKYGFLIWYGAIFIISSLPFVVICKFVRLVETEIDSKGVIDIINHVFNKLNMYSFGFLITGIILIAIACILRASDRINNQE